MLCQGMGRRRYGYKKHNNGANIPLTVFNILDEYGVENCQIILVELFPCNSNEELEQRETEYIKNKVCVSKYVPLRTRKEWEGDSK